MPFIDTTWTIPPSQQKTEEVDLAGLLSAAMKNFNPRPATLDESDMENQWNQGLKQRLASSEKRFRESHPAIIGQTIANPAMSNPAASTALSLAIQEYKARPMTSCKWD
jgi:hypothetical protein